jgi:hypothetical protein
MGLFCGLPAVADRNPCLQIQGGRAECGREQLYRPMHLKVLAGESPAVRLLRDQLLACETSTRLFKFCMINFLHARLLQGFTTVA